jgi:isoamylase
MAITAKKLGALFNQGAATLEFNVFSKNSTRIDLYLYDVPSGTEEKITYSLTKDADAIWSIVIPLAEARSRGISATIYYGYRAWGPNWPYDAAWRKGSAAGFVADVDNDGNRFNPNKLLVDPYAREISHDPQPRLSSIDPNECLDDYYTGDDFRGRDTGKIAPKGIVFTGGDDTGTGQKPGRLLKDDIIYEVHLRGFTMLDEALPQALRGTFQGASRRASYLKDLGVTAVEFLPVQAFANEQNDDGDPRGDNYWGYMTLGYFAPNRRYSSDKSPGGPTREFKQMVRAFHDQGIKVFLDVVLNHTAEGLLKRVTEDDGSRNADDMQFSGRACLLSLRGLDNASYYELRSNRALDAGRTFQRYQDNTGCGGNLKVKEEAVRDLALDVLDYWSRDMGVDGFRFDLAPVLGNAEEQDRFRFDAADPGNILNRAVRELPARSPETLQGVDLIAEPWALGDGTYQLGNFPDGWSEWNDVFRDTFRKAENRLGVAAVANWQISNVFAGSDQQFGRKRTPLPSHSINYLASHDGFTLRDLYSYSGDGFAWDHHGDRAEQRKAVRNALTILMVSAGVPMIMGGDELFRTLHGRTNTAAVDDPSVYLDWNSIAGAAARAGEARGLAADEVLIYRFAANVLGFRNSHLALRPGAYYSGALSSQTGLRDIAWYGSEGGELSGGAWSDPARQFLGFRVDGKRVKDSASSIFVGYNRGEAGVDLRLPLNLPGEKWYRVSDSSGWMEPAGNWESPGTLIDGQYLLHGRGIAIFVERPE